MPYYQPMTALLGNRAIPKTIPYVVFGEVRVLLHHGLDIPHVTESERSRPHETVRADAVVVTQAPLTAPLIDDRPRVDDGILLDQRDMLSRHILHGPD